MKTYQALVILKNTTAEDAIQGVLEAVRGEITKQKGAVLDTAFLGKQAFARPMEKMDSGYYARIRFSLDPQSQAALLARLKLIDALFRVQIVNVRPADAAKPEQAGAAAEGAQPVERKPDA